MPRRLAVFQPNVFQNNVFQIGILDGGGKKKPPHVATPAPTPAYDDPPKKKPVWPIWDQVRYLEEQRRRQAQAAPQAAPPPQEIFRVSQPHVVTPAGLPTFREYAPQDAAGLARQMQEARELAAHRRRADDDKIIELLGATEFAEHQRHADDEKIIGLLEASHHADRQRRVDDERAIAMLLGDLEQGKGVDGGGNGNDGPAGL